MRAELRGAVQGVGFRPFVWRLAKRFDLAGWAANTGEGLTLEVEGAVPQVYGFLRALEREAPRNAKLRELSTRSMPVADSVGFEIRESRSTGRPATVMQPDLATCEDCLAELFDPADRRHLYPFINCTNCGPRYSIIEGLPYDRQRTSMGRFAMCQSCAAEYASPASRRFHAEPNACPDCGPKLALWDQRGSLIADREAALLQAADSLRQGAILAVKGIGGFQLLVDAGNDAAVVRLRARKRRPDKPFAVMCPSLAAARTLCEISAEEAAWFAKQEAPILLLARRGDAGLASSVAPGNPSLGVMLPYSPLHHLLLRTFGGTLVATSGNRSDEPIVIDEQDALERLDGIADLYLVHDRPILRPGDDSVLRFVAGRPTILRRARGFAPLSIPLGREGPPVLGLGGHMKSSVALGFGDEALVSQHLGDLETAEAENSFGRTVAELTRIYAVEPVVIAHDLHPDYRSTKLAASLPGRRMAVQHHLAHVAAVMAEQGLGDPVLGIAWDGTGYGGDGTIWGGEFLLVGGSGFRRVAHLRQFPLPGGDRAIEEPRRAAFGLLFELLGGGAIGRDDLAPVASFAPEERRILARAAARGLNAPRTSSIGRLFDAVASLLDLRQRSTYEGQAAAELEWAAGSAKAERAYPQSLVENGDAALELDWAPALAALLADLANGMPRETIAAAFHDGLIEGLVAIARRIGERRVVLSGGCFQNKRLLEGAIAGLRQAGFEPFWPAMIPPNDGGLALGQVAWARRCLAQGER